MNNKVIYTCITNGYDCLHQPKAVYEGYDYICFTDDVKCDRVGVWQIKKIPFDLEDKIRLSRYLKLMPHIALADYKYSVYIDSNILILDDYLYHRVEREITNGSLMSLSKHPEGRKDIYEEAAYVMKYRRAKFKDVKEQVRFVNKMNYPRNIGMYENNIIFRQHNHSNVVKIDSEWWGLFQRFTARDQLSLSFVLWNNGIEPTDLMGEGHRLNVKAKFQNDIPAHLQRIHHTQNENKGSSLVKKIWNYFIFITCEIPRFYFYKWYFQYIIRLFG